MEEIHIFLDTNIILNYNSVLELDWTNLTKSSKVKLLFCLQVIRELDDKKHDLRLGSRSKEALKKIEQFNKNIIKNVHYEIFPNELTSGYLGKSKDAIILSHINEYKKINPLVKTVICTEDVGMKICAEASSIEIFTLDKKFRIEDLRNEKNNKQSVKIEPNLGLSFNRIDEKINYKESKIVSFSIKETSIDEMFEKHIQSNNLYAKKYINNAISMSGFITKEDVDEYNGSLSKYLLDYKNWLVECLDFKNSISLSLYLFNTGNKHADDIDVTIEIHRSICKKLLDYQDYQNLKKIKLSNKPSIPKLENKFFKFLNNYSFPDCLNNKLFFDNNKLYLSKKYSMEENDDKFYIKFTTDRIKKNNYEKICDFTVVLKNIKSLQFNCKISSIDTEEISNKMPIIVNCVK